MEKVVWLVTIYNKLGSARHFTFLLPSHISSLSKVSVDLEEFKEHKSFRLGLTYVESLGMDKRITSVGSYRTCKILSEKMKENRE